VKQYELTVLVHPDLETKLDLAVDKVKKIITESGGKIIKEEAQGKKRLAYNISGNEFAVYVFMELELPPEAPLKISSVLNITDEILRYLLVIKDEKLEKAQQQISQKGEED
jgi:small subunit ribosomal protein S6